ncbi:histone deacetylase family protein [Halanaerobaculum tunisiense]
MNLTAQNSVGLIFFPAFDWSISPTHPEREERLLYTKDLLSEEGIFDITGIEEYNPQLATISDIERTQICIPKTEEIVTKPHLISVGGAIKAGELVMEEKVDKAFAIIRPPGHHAFTISHGTRGFCTINNEAIMVDYLRQNYDPELKIAIIDTDAHHADGTQNIFYNDPNVLHIDLHQDGRTLFPGTGFTDELGWPGGYGYTINLPLPTGTTDQGLHYALDNLVLPILDDFNPDLIINSAGQDNHYSDPLTNMKITAQGYARLNDKLDPDLAILQGGYDIEGALPYTNLGIILAMAGIDYSEIQEPDYNPQIKDQPANITEEIKRKVNYLREKWEAKEEVDKAKKFGTDYYTTSQQIIYDTDQIREEQEVKIKVCSSCSGMIAITSQANPTSYKASQIIILPYDCCSECRNKGYQRYETATDSPKYQFSYLLDKQQNKLISEY